MLTGGHRDKRHIDERQKHLMGVEIRLLMTLEKAVLMTQ